MAGPVLTVTVDGQTRIKVQLRRFSSAASDMRPGFERIADWFADEERRLFDSEGSAYPPGWPALSPRYADWKRRRVGNKPILEFTGRLRRSLTRRPFGQEFISRDTLTVGTDVPYARYHQRGTGRLPRRPPLIKQNRAVKTRLTKMLQEHLLSEMERA